MSDVSLLDEDLGEIPVTITTTDTYVIAQDPVDPRALFDAARKAAGAPEKWNLHDGPDFGDVHMYQTRSPTPRLNSAAASPGSSSAAPEPPAWTPPSTRP